MAARFWVGGTGTWDNSSTANWAATSGGASGASAPVAADTVTFDVNSGSGICTTASGATCATITLNSSTVSLTLDASLTISGTFTLTLGALTLGSNTLSCLTFSSTNTNVRSIAYGTGNITVTGNNASVYNTDIATNLTITGTPVVNATYSGATGTRQVLCGTTGGNQSNSVTVNITAGSDIFATGAANRFYLTLNFTGFSGTFTNGARTLFNNLIFSSTMTLSAGTNATTFAATSPVTITTAGKTFDFPIVFNGVNGTFAFQDALTQGSTRAFTITNGTVQLKDGVTTTVGVFATSGANQKFLTSTTAGVQATISQASGTVNASNLTIKDINATGGATWNALWSNNNEDGGNNTGWFFGDPPITLATEYTYSIRSFTQPRRF